MEGDSAHAPWDDDVSSWREVIGQEQAVTGIGKVAGA